MNTYQSINISQEKFRPIANDLNQLLADYHIYYQNLRNFHWNVKGPHFFELHRQFETLYSEARLSIDAIAERILTIQHRPLSTISEYLEHSQIDEAQYVKSDSDMVRLIIDNHTKLTSVLRTTLKSASENSDEGTIDLLASDLERLEKHSWMLSAWSSQVPATMHKN